MRIFLSFSILLLVQLSSLSQNKNDIKTHLKTNGDLEFELKQDNNIFQSSDYQSIITSFKHSISGNIIRINSTELIYKGKTKIYLSQKPSAFQTEILFTLRISKTATGTRYILNHIHYKSIPEYGKQGSPAIHTTCSDWFSPKRLYRKSGKMRRQNQNLLANSSTFAENLLLSCIL